MAGITLAQAETQLAAWLAASAAIAKNQSYEIDTGSGGRRAMTRADAGKCREMIDYWQGRVAELTAAAISTSGAVRRRTRQIAPG